MRYAKRIYQKLYSTIKTDECQCLICNACWPGNLWDSSFICTKCQDQFIVHRKAYYYHNTWIYVLYEYNEFLERLLFRFKDQKDIALYPVFLDEYHTLFQTILKKHIICVMCSSEVSRMKRGFEPNFLILHSYTVYSPLYKKTNIKQSSNPHRENIHQVIEKKNLYTLPNQKILLFDDVCTTGHTIERGMDLLQPDVVFLLSAHPLWIERMAMEKQKRF
ncbi:ComF family protein [Floccifex sp.]|uniref:ComF family protein n=1 Tax=Floccifex sp. TaxID=2815810 RepID=UPI003F05A1A7